MSGKQSHFGFEDELFNLKVDRAVALLRLLHGKDYVIAYSGGKDSDVIFELAKMAGLDRRPVYHVTTIDAPEVVQHCRSKGVLFLHHGKSFYGEVAKRGVPSRWRRWCCSEFKHNRPVAVYTVLGVRASESPARKARWQELNRDADLIAVCPIVEWSDADVWRFLGERHCAACSLYGEGFRRLGCVGCCLVSGARKREFARWPSIGAAVKRSFFKFGSTHSQTAEQVERFWDDWVNDRTHERVGKETGCLLDLWESGASNLPAGAGSQ